MNYIQEIETAIVSRLQDFENLGYTAIALPEKQTDFEKPFLNGKITVCYHSSEYATPQATMQVSQHETVNIIISVQSRRLRTLGANIGIYDMIALLRKYLIGFIPTGALWRMFAKEVQLNKAEFSENLWTYYAIFSVKTLAVEDFAPITEPPITEITFNTQTE